MPSVRDNRGNWREKSRNYWTAMGCYTNDVANRAREVSMIHPDVSVYSRKGKLQLVVEVKKRPGANERWVRQLRRNLIAHGFIPSSTYFMLALPDKLHLWKEKSALPDAAPDFQASTPEVLRPYLGAWALDELTEQSFELVIKTWLGALVHSRLTPEAVPPELRWVVDSGLYGVIRDGSIGEPVA